MTETMNIIDYCNLNKIKTLPINLEIKDGKKRYLDGEKGRFKDGRYNFKMTDFGKLSLEQCRGFTQFYDDETIYIAIDTTTIHQLDIDDPAWWEDQAREDKYDDWYLILFSPKIVSKQSLLTMSSSLPVTSK